MPGSNASRRSSGHAVTLRRDRFWSTIRCNTRWRSILTTRAYCRRATQSSSAVRYLLLVLLLLVMTDRPTAAQQPPWADSELPVSDGLIGWFDASSLDAALREQGVAINHGALIPQWPDGSSPPHHLVQLDEEKRPLWVDVDGYRAVRFLGDNQTLSWHGDAKSLDSATIILVATPFSNSGAFAGPVALSSETQNDYLSGFNLDQGPTASTRWEVINVEGAGFDGARDLYDNAAPFGQQQRIAVTLGSGEQSVQVRVNGQMTGERPRNSIPLEFDRWVLGGRWYNHGSPPIAQGFFHGDVAALLVYDRVLSEEELLAVDQYLLNRFGDERVIPIPQAADGRVPLVALDDVPCLQMLVPGFRALRLPIELTNINNLVYRDDGRLMALGYDGRLWWLDDTDSDGLEDTATLYFDGRSTFRGPIGLALTPNGYPHGFGAIVPSKGKLSFIVDNDGDGIGDEERVIATGWQEITQSVDALGVDINPIDGSIWFGLGTGDYTNAYRIDEQGRARYELSSDRGTIQRISPDLKHRETIATGIRFPVGLRFSEEGEPFVTDQEGATWLANGNPFDELLHIELGRHYGFPPRHPQHLPSVIDEPSLFDYGPQHQSTCGLNFNRPVRDDGPIFGPAHWRNHLFVAGYSRGKLYRTQVVRTPEGFVATNQLIGCSNRLLVDAVVTPRGGLLLSLHSGGPDWGSGPNGEGELWLIESIENTVRPVAAWRQSPSEIHIALDGPIDPTQLPNAAQVTIEFGVAVAAGDRFETLRPGYQVVADQLRQPRYRAAARWLQVTPDLQTIVIGIDPSDVRVPRAITLPGLGRTTRIAGDVQSQYPETDLLVTDHGVRFEWQSVNPAIQQSGWVPHLDLEIARSLLQGSAAHERLWSLLEETGCLTLETQLDLAQMLRPAVQPGAKIDYELPEELITLSIQLPADAQLEANVGQWREQPIEAIDGARFKSEMLGQISATEAKRLELKLRIQTGENLASQIRIRWWTQEDSTPRALPVTRQWLPWTQELSSESARQLEREATLTVGMHPLEQGGNWERGSRLFHSEALACSKCHRFGARGGEIGPDLSNLPLRDVDSIVRDIEQPSFAINPDYVTQTVESQDGGRWVGVLRTEGERLIIGLNDGTQQSVAREQIENIAPWPHSTMPEGLMAKLKQTSPTALADLLVFLRTSGPRLPTYAPFEPPAPRTIDALDRLYAVAATNVDRSKHLHLLLVDGVKDHGAGEHDYPAWKEVWGKWLQQAENVTVDFASQWPTQEQWAVADTVVIYQRGDWNETRARDVDRHFARGGGLVLIHWAVDGQGDVEGFSRRIGLAADSGKIKYRHGPLQLDFGPGAQHPIARNFSTVDFYDESYWLMDGDAKRLSVLATGIEEGEARPLFWTLEPQGGRVFVSILGHYMWTFDDPVYRTLMLRALAWSAGEDVDRFMPIVESGARIAKPSPQSEATAPQ